MSFERMGFGTALTGHNVKPQRPPFHPFGYASTGNRELAFIRISKNASGSITGSLGLRGWTHASALQGFDIYCALRHPVARFYSSIVETTLRARLYQDMKFFGDIVVDPEVFWEMHRLLGEGRLPDYTWFVLEVIAERGPFDAHHERQVNFLRDFEPYFDEITFFDVAQTDAVLAKMMARYGGAQQDINRRHVPGRSKIDLDRMRLAKQRIKQSLFAKPLSPRHLLMNGANGYGPVRYGSRAYLNGARAFYEKVRSVATPEMDAKIAQLYAEDMALFEQHSR